MQQKIKHQRKKFYGKWIQIIVFFYVSGLTN